MHVHVGYTSHVFSVMQKPFGGVSMFGDPDGASFLTESIRSNTSKGESPKVKHSTSSGTGLFNSKEEEEEEGEGELFSSSSSK